MKPDRFLAMWAHCQDLKWGEMQEVVTAAEQAATLKLQEIRKRKFKALAKPKPKPKPLKPDDRKIYALWADGLPVLTIHVRASSLDSALTAATASKRYGKRHQWLLAGVGGDDFLESDVRRVDLNAD